MVIRGRYQPLLTTVLLAQQSTRPVLERLDPPKRAYVLMTIFGLVLTGLVLALGVMVGAHWVRRLARQRPRSHERMSDSASRLANKRLRSALETVLPNVDTSATVQIDTSTGDTKVDDKPRPKDGA